jgi:NTP pyrophosphatase (non-canonical NTP hydrolase)
MVDGVANKEIFASELADIVCCVLIIAGKENIDMEYALTTCMEKNYMRATGKGDK